MEHIQKIKLSFVVPIYGVEQYLRKCVDSLLHQDYDNYEIILVDDGSPDGSPAICDEYAARYDNIRVIHRENGGLSAARNSGIELARGEYICFVDSDDYWEENVLGGLMEQIEREQLYVLRFDYQNVRIKDSSEYEVFEPYKQHHTVDTSTAIVSGVEYLNTRMPYGCYAWQFIIRTAIVKGERFTEGIYFEDTDWTPRMLLCASRVNSTTTVVYNYLMRIGSITQAIDQAKQRKVLDDKLRLISTLKRLRDEVSESRWFDGMIAQTVVSILGMVALDFWSERIRICKELHEMRIFPLTCGDSFNRTKLKWINLSPRLYCGLIHYKYKLKQ